MGAKCRNGELSYPLSRPEDRNVVQPSRGPIFDPSRCAELTLLVNPFSRFSCDSALEHTKLSSYSSSH